MLNIIAQASAWLLLCIVLSHALGRYNHRYTWVISALGAALFTNFNADATIKQILGLETQLPIGIAPLLFIAAMGLILRVIKQRGWRPYQLMSLIALLGWSIAHAAFWVGEKQWLEPRIVVIQAKQYTWINDQPLAEQLRICKGAELACTKSQGRVYLTQDTLTQEKHQLLASTLLPLSAVAGICYSLGLLVLMHGHRRKRHV
jgi:hypothetical protein